MTARASFPKSAICLAQIATAMTPTYAVAQEFFCVTARSCIPDPAGCRDASYPVSVTRGPDYSGTLRFDNGADATGRVTMVAGQLSGQFSEPDGDSWDLEMFIDRSFTLVEQSTDRAGRPRQTYFEGTCEGLN